MFKKLCIVTAAVMTVFAMSISILWQDDDMERRDEKQAIVTAIVNVCSKLREASFQYEQAKRNRFVAYSSDLTLQKGGGAARNRYFRKLLVGSSAESFAHAAVAFSELLVSCEEAVTESRALGSPIDGRTSPLDVSSAADDLPELALGEAATKSEIDAARNAVDRFAGIDQELVARSSGARSAAARAIAEVLKTISDINADMAYRSRLALLLQLAATAVVMAKDLAD